MWSSIRQRIPQPLKRRARRIITFLARRLRRTFEITGLNVARRDDYYSTLPTESVIRRNVRR